MKQAKVKRTLVLLLTALIIICMFTPIAFANSAEPPALTIIVSFPPDDLTLTVRFTDGSIIDAIQLSKEKKAWEAYYRFFYSMGSQISKTFEGATLIVQSQEINFERRLPESTFSLYSNLLTLDLVNESISEGQTLFRSAFLMSMRIVLTLLIEGLIFFMFGYRKRISWAAFIIVNLFTQGALNMALSGPDLGSYWFFAFFFYEVIIFIVEIIALNILLKEYTKDRATAFALTANFASLILGMFIISYLPF